uniref:non-specific serine/threonine protein kinase n=1 Tax=Quercus lobata TaxID=97700 RepID=A0A7N2LKD2_QUELO
MEMKRQGRKSPVAAMSLSLLCSIHFQAILLLFVVLLHVKTLTVFGDSTGTTSSVGGNETDHQALLAFKSKITLDPRNIFSSWNDSNHFCQWEGVTCGRKHRRVTILDLRSRDLVGSLSPYIGNLSFLRQIVLANNTIGDKIPDEVGRLYRLRVLMLYNNSFDGEIPANLSHCSNLNFISVARNNLSGSIPKQLASLSMLKSLSFDTNNLMGGIPPFIGNLSSLQLISAADNVLGGHIPDALGQLQSLKYLGLGGNKLSDLFLTLPRLQWFQIDRNQFTGSLPVSLSNASELELFLIEENNFTGKVSVNFGGLQRLEKLIVDRNNLRSGDADEMDFFQSLANCSNLQILDIRANQFKGEVPTKGVFANSSAISLIGNSRLCGGISELKFPRCLTKEEKKAKWPLAVKVAISMACVIPVVTIMSFFLFCRHKSQRKDNSSESSLRQSLLKVSYQVLLKATDGFSPTSLIGVGSFGSVYKGILGEDESIVAVKVINIQRQGASKSFISECEALKNIRHRNLVKIITSCSSVDFHGNDFKALVFEFMPNGSLENWLHMDLETNTRQVDIQNLNLVQRISIAIDVACALDYLHHRCPMPIVHCDLKPSNILFDCDMIAHIGDFGLAKFLLELTNPKQSDSFGIRGTIGYTPPEYGVGCDVSTKGDVYSYGILLLEMITGKRPTNCVFEGGLNLHNYASMALPNRVIEISDPKLLNNCGDTDRTEECLISMVKIGVSCSMELPQERWDIIKALSELYLVRDILHGARI